MATPRWPALIGLLVLVLLGAGLGACEPTRSFERTSDGTTVYLDERSAEVRTEARQKIVQELIRGAPVFDLGVGDEFEVFFHLTRRPAAKAYVIAIADKLRIEFLNDEQNARAVQVRPDGRISMPLIGSVLAAGLTPEALARQLEDRYRSTLTAPQITVNVAEAHTPLEDFIEMVGASSKARSIVDRVLPDGTIALPRLTPIKVRGHTLDYVKHAIDTAYAAQGLGITVSLVPKLVRPGTTFVLGEVAKPGRFELDRPRTVLMLMAQAGGVLPTGSMSSIRVLYNGDDGKPRVRSIDLTQVLQDLKLEDDMVVPDNSVIYVPPTELAKAGRLMDAVVRDILRFNGFSISGSYLLNNSGGGSSPAVITTPASP
jgi:polysaccharide export outer membrane protein